MKRATQESEARYTKTFEFILTYNIHELALGKSTLNSCNLGNVSINKVLSRNLLL